MQYNIDFVIGALVVTGVTMAYYFLSPRLNDRQGNIFAAVGILLFVVSALDIVGVLLDGIASDAVLYAVNMVFLTSLNTLPALMLIYMIIISGKIDSMRLWHWCVILLPLGAVLYITVTSPIDGQGFFVSGRHYRPGPLSFSGFASCGVYILMALIVVYTARRRMTHRRLAAICAFTIIEPAALIFQYLHRNVLLTEFAASISLLIMYIAMQPSEEISDPVTNAYTMTATNTLAARYFSRRQHFTVFCYSVESLRRINDLYGEATANEFLKFIVRSLGQTFGGRVGRVYGGEFCVLTDRFRTPEETAAAAEKLPTVWKTDEYVISFEASKIILDSGTFQNPGEMQELMEFSLRFAKSMTGATTLLVDNRLRARYYRRQLVRVAVTDAIRENRVNVFYQPIVNASDGKIAAAEALARISDMRLGSISPAEFIPIAEQSGLILSLGKCIRAKVWELISEYDIRAGGVEHISINLSALECAQRPVMEAILREESLAGAGKGLIHLEITETAAVTSEEVLAENMKMMRDNGFAFQMDDYGTGYSSMSNLILLPFDVVKIDRSIINMAEDERRGSLVRRMIFPFHGYGIKVICEGIETEEQAQMVRSWGADYIQGYLYSRPLPPEAFIEYAKLKKRSLG